MTEADSVQLRWNGERLQLLPERALLLPDHAALVIADWHLGKSEIFRRAGIAVPDGGTEADLSRLDQLIAHFRPSQLLVLGDLVHGAVRADSPWLSRLKAWRRRHPQLALRAVVGNHDRHIQALPLDECLPALQIGSLRCVHESSATAAAPELAGHLHPVMRLSGVGMRERVPVFWLRPRSLILPSFGGFTGGHPIQPGAGDQVYAALPQAVIAIRR